MFEPGFRSFGPFGAGAFWRYQLLLGIVILAIGVAIALFPEILVALVAAAVCMVGISLIASALRIRAASRGARRRDPFEV